MEVGMFMIQPTAPTSSLFLQLVDDSDIRGFPALFILLDLELDTGAGLECSKTLHIDGGVMDHNVLHHAFLADVAKPLRVIEPFHDAGRHEATPISNGNFHVRQPLRVVLVELRVQNVKIVRVAVRLDPGPGIMDHIACTT